MTFPPQAIPGSVLTREPVKKKVGRVSRIAHVGTITVDGEGTLDYSEDLAQTKRPNATIKRDAADVERNALASTGGAAMPARDVNRLSSRADEASEIEQKANEEWIEQGSYGRMREPE